MKVEGSPQPEPKPTQEGEGQNVSYFKPLRTFEDDVNSLLKQGGSLASAKIAEVKATTAKEKELIQARTYAVRTMNDATNVASVEVPRGVQTLQVPHEESHWVRNILAVIVGFALIAGGSFAVYKLYQDIQAKNAYVPDIPVVVKQSPIVVDSQQALEITNANRQKVLEGIRGLKIGFQELVLYKTQGETYRFASFAEVRNLLGLTIPNNLERLITNYMIGSITTTESHGFIAFNVNVFEGAMSGMSMWETSIVQDLQDLVRPQAATDTQVLAIKDVVVRNRDTRSFTTNTGTPVLTWGFISKNVILVTDTPESFAAILDRYLNGAVAR